MPTALTSRLRDIVASRLSRIFQGIIVSGIALLVIFAIACSNPARPSDMNSVTITLQRTACYGWCPIYAVTLRGSGLVEYAGEMYVDIPGHQTRPIAPDRVKALLSSAEKIHFFNLANEYAETCTDMPTTIIFIEVDGRSKRVSNYYGGCEQKKSGTQVDLAKFADEIDVVSGADHWLQCDSRGLAKLITDGLQVNSQSSRRGETPLLVAVQKNDPAKVTLLLDAGANVNQPDNEATTPLMEAVMKNQPAMVRLLLSRGADMNAKNKQGFTAKEMTGPGEVRNLVTRK